MFPEPSPARRLSVQVKGLPPGATLRLDGRKTTLPLSLVLDGNEHILEVSAPGFKSHVQLFQATDDLRVLHVRLNRGPRLRWTRTRGRGVKPSPMVTTDGVFPNPHTMR